MATSLPEFGQFDCADLSNAGPRWKKWLARFEVLVAALNIGDENDDRKRKKALLLHYMGEECFDIYETVKEEGDVYDVVKTKLSDYFVPKSNCEYEKYVFRNTKQREGETLDQFCTRLRKLSVNCNFGEILNNEVKSQMIQGCVSTSLRKKALGKAMDLQTLLETGRQLEQTRSQASVMEGISSSGTTEVVNKTWTDRGRGRGSKDARPKSRPGTSGPRKQWPKPVKEGKVDSTGPNRTCFTCGGAYPHPEDCPAKNRRCYQCGDFGHYGKLCKKKSQKKQQYAKCVQPAMQEDVRPPSGSDSDYSLAVHSTSSPKDKIPEVKLTISGVKCKLLIDSGASVDILDRKTFLRICDSGKFEKGKPVLEPPDTNLFAYGGGPPLPLLGKFSTAVERNVDNIRICTVFYVTKSAEGCLLSYDTARKLGLINIVNTLAENRCEMLLCDFDNVFQGLGRLKDFQLKLNIDTDVVPLHQKHRRVPFSTRKKVEDAVKQLIADDICEDPGNDPTPWVSPIVVVPKPNAPDQIRLCVDMRAANQAIKRVKHPMPTVDELIHDLNGCKFFSKLDLNQGYHQIELHPDSRYITTFSTHLGLHRYKRLNFGVNAASEKFQQILESVLKGLQGVRNISDDIIIASESEELHGIHVRACLQRLSDSGLTLNRKKCMFFQSSMSFFGNIFSEDGISPDPKKISAVCDAPRPVDKKQVRSLLGMVNYVQRYIPGLATLVKPLRELIKTSTNFVWSDECESAWITLKSSLTDSSTMSYFDPNQKTELLVDASPVGLGAILTQIDADGDRRYVVAYASKSCDDVESRYSQIEREALAVRWGIEHYHLYLYGAPFTVVTDHKPLVSVFSNVLAKPSPRIERWCLRLQQYTFRTEYRPGANNPADYMSRHPLPSTNVRGRKVTEEYINFVCESSCPKALSVEDIRKATQEDALLQNVMLCIVSGQWHKYRQCEEMAIFQKVAPELSVTEQGVILRGHRIVIPSCMRSQIVEIGHEGHQGLVKTKSLLRAKVWFPYMDRAVEQVVRSCVACSAVVKDERMHPLKMSDLPERPWQCICADFGGPYPSGDYCLVVIDEYSRFPVVELVRSTSSRSVIPIMDKIFATHGIPERLKTDNGPPFQSYEFRRFLEYSGVKHRRITPLWPRANAQAENFMKPLNKAIKAATVEGKSWQQEMHKFLRNYHATPHVSTNRPPAELLFGTNIRVRLPECSVPICDDEVRAQDAQSKLKQKYYADKKNCNRPPVNYSVGDTVLIKQNKYNKLTPAYNPEPMVVEQVKGSMITARSPGLGTKTRNASLYKRIEDCRVPDELPVTEDYETDVLKDNVQEIPTVPVSVMSPSTPNPSTPIPTCRPKRQMKKPSRYNDFI